MRTHLQTERLILREVCPDDLNGLFELDSDPEVHKYLGNNCVTDKAQVLNTIKSLERQYRENGIGRWAIIDKQTGDFVGWAGLKLIKETLNGHSDFYDLGYRLLRKYWGQGIATESAMASLHYGFETMGLKSIFACAHIENIPSNCVLKKVGFNFIETFPYENWQKNWYSITNDDWRKIAGSFA